MKIIVGMSGGVDSAVAALMLKEQGHEVIGVTLEVVPEVPPCEGSRAGGEGAASARGVAERIGVRHLTIDARGVFRRRVIEYFTNSYRAGRTPNPCIVCNPEIKFASLLRCADELGAAAVATGHYARIAGEGSRTLLLRGADRRKDQAYFLSRLTRGMLSRVIFPLGDRTKDEIRRISAGSDLKIHERPESQEICFIPGDDYRAFLASQGGAGTSGGDILDTRGAVIGTHPGIEQFTIGQRVGRYIASSARQYVLSIDPESRTITVGGPAGLLRRECTVVSPNWIAIDRPREPFRALVKIRSSHPGAEGMIRTKTDGSVAVRFDEAQSAVTPGQAAVFFDGDVVIGGGWIAAAHPASTERADERSSSGCAQR
jgi:tRNA-specific 2-thiouridylase